MLPSRLTTAPADGRVGTTGGRRSAFRALASTLAAAVALAVPAGCSDEGSPAQSAGATTRTAPRGETGRDSTSLETTRSSVVRFRGTGDRVLRPIRVRRGGTTIHWTNNGSERVFSLLTQSAIVVDAAFGKSGERFLPPGRYVLEVVASGR